MTTLQIIAKPSLEKRAYRLRCRFRIEAYPQPSRLELAKVRMAERFVNDMHDQGWEYMERSGFKMAGPFPMVEPVVIHRPRTLSAREMLAGVLAGKPFRNEGADYAKPVLGLDVQEYWEFELAGIFAHTQLLTEYPDTHEEEKG